jgi:hypothetical protein
VSHLRFYLSATKEAQYEYDQWIKGVAGHQSTVYWSSLKLDFYAPGSGGRLTANFRQVWTHVA